MAKSDDADELNDRGAPKRFFGMDEEDGAEWIRMGSNKRARVTMDRLRVPLCGEARSESERVVVMVADEGCWQTK
jgi:hypothetical protein